MMLNGIGFNNKASFGNVVQLGKNLLVTHNATGRTFARVSIGTGKQDEFITTEIIGTEMKDTEQVMDLDMFKEHDRECVINSAAKAQANRIDKQLNTAPENKY